MVVLRRQVRPVKAVAMVAPASGADGLATTFAGGHCSVALYRAGVERYGATYPHASGNGIATLRYRRAPAVYQRVSSPAIAPVQ
jgi:hypothetical protein